MVLKLDTGKLPQNIYSTDGARITQIVNNLLSNAIKFTHEGHIKLTASVLKSKGKTDWVHLEVEDTGIGISAENANLIFEEFGRIPSNGNIQYEGTGLGLPITKRIVELMKGNIRFKSTFGKGSRFMVVLPLQRRSKKTNIETKPDSHPIKKQEKKTFNKERVLLADDDPFLLELTTHLLKEANLEVYPYAQASEAMDALNNQPFDILITDVQMPGVNGFELLSHFKSKYREPKIALAITGESNKKQHYLDAGFHAIIQKPFQPEELINTVSALLKGPFIPAADTGKNKNSLNPIYSIEGIMAFAEGEMETTREILTSFAQSTAQNLTEFSHHIQRKDYQEIKNLAHKMLPMFRQLEAVEIIEPLRKLEQENFNSHEDEWLEESNQVLRKIESLMEKIIEEYQLPFSGKLIS